MKHFVPTPYIILCGIFHLSQPTNVFLYPYIAGWFARCEELSQHDFSFIKQIMLGGSVIDPTTMELLEKAIPGTFLNLVNVLKF